MKKFKTFLLIILLIPCLFLLNACSLDLNQVYVTDIQQTSTLDDGTTTYTVYFSNGKTSLLTVKNGKDGVDGDDLTIESIRAYCIDNELDFDDFMEKYLTVVQENASVQTATNKAVNSTVTITSEFTTGTHILNRGISLAGGSGIIYKMEEDYSYIVTNYHVVYYYQTNKADKIASKITIFQYGTTEAVYDTKTTDENGYPVYTYGDGAIQAEFVGGSMNYDLAVLKVETAKLKQFNENATAVTIADGYTLSETAIAIGNPEGLGFSVTSGIISVVSEILPMTGADEITPCEFRVMRIDTAVNGGNSGGGLFNIYGELIGIVNAKAISSDIDNIAYALPYDNVTKVVDNLIYYYEQTSTPSSVKKLYLNVQYTTENSRAIYNPLTETTSIYDDFVITSIAESGLGHTIGFEVGDIVKSISINGTEHLITRSYQLTDWLLEVREGDKIMFTVNRDGISRELGLTTEDGISETHLTEIK